MKKEFTPSEYKYPLGFSSPLNFNLYGMKIMRRVELPPVSIKDTIRPTPELKIR